MIQKQLTWIGLSVKDYLIDAKLGEGAFAWVYGGQHKDGIRKAAFKVAKPPEFVETASFAKGTQALAIWSGFTQNVRPDCSQLLTLQAQAIQACNDPSLVKIEEVVHESGFAYLQLELLEGQTLREVMTSDAVSISSVIEIAETMERLSQTGKWTHGDLKPDNILVTASGVKIIDPGYFGPLDCFEGQNLSTAVTTTSYYPLLIADDLLSFGIMLWEIATKQHPLVSDNLNDLDDKNVSQDLYDWISSYASSGLYFLKPILALRPPKEAKPVLPVQIQNILLKAMRLSILPNGKLGLDPGFESFAEIAIELAALKKVGLEYL